MGYIVNISGDSGYTRDDFVAALGGKQDKLYSGQNIKTVGGKSVLGSGNLDFTQGGGEQEYTYELTDYEIGLKNGVLNKLAQLNPNGKYMTFGVISDTHTWPTKADVESQYSSGEVERICQEIINAGIEFRGDGVTDASSAAAYIKDNWPERTQYYTGRTCEPNLILLGAIGHEYGLDAVFCAGDLAEGCIQVGPFIPTPYDCNTYAMWRVGQLFKKYISVPMFFTEGNHDRWYGDSRTDISGCRGCAEWRKWLNVLNTPNMARFPEIDTVRYKDSDGNFLPGNTYCVDFQSKKVKVVMRSQYEKQEYVSTGKEAQSSNQGSGTFYKYLFDSLLLDAPSEANDWSLLAVSHNLQGSNYFYSSYYTHFLDGGSFPAQGYASTDYFVLGQLNGGNKGKCICGEILGHKHPESINPSPKLTSAGNLEYVTMLNAGMFTKAELATQRNGSDYYCFSIFVLDDDNFKLHEIKVGYQYHTDSEAYDATRGIFTFPLKHN